MLWGTASAVVVFLSAFVISWLPLNPKWPFEGVHWQKHLPGDMERLSAALPVAGHASSTRSLALPSVVLTYVAGLAKQQTKTQDEETDVLDMFPTNKWNLQRSPQRCAKFSGSCASFVIPVRATAPIVVLAGLSQLQHGKVSESVDSLFKKQKFCSSMPETRAVPVPDRFRCKTVDQMFWNAGLKGWSGYVRTCIHYLYVL